MLFCNGDCVSDIFMFVVVLLMVVYKCLKDSFDLYGIFNLGCLFLVF